MEKQRGDHLERIEKFKRSGRIIQVERDPQPATIQAMHSEFVETQPETEAGRSKRRPRNKWFDRTLLLIETAAVLGLILIMVNAFSSLRILNTEVASALKQPTLTPTALISAVILPSGHTPPNAAGGAQPNEAEIPEHLRPVVQSLANIPIPTASPEQASRIQIGAINVDAPVVQGTGWEQLKKGVGQFITSSDPGKPGNLILSAHNDVFGEIFRDLDKLKTGDSIVVFTNTKQYTYTVTGTEIVKPTQTEVMAATKDATLTLISCYPYMVDNQRIVVKAALNQ